ncbi:hypothetical protein ACFQT0_04860 [Hymenobacter humi]|uniref:Uncharacterized protein n=1 Tax=Hymenobacter humi TaxID=1411620 RepID=A0ABW2TZZ9_9BACT
MELCDQIQQEAVVKEFWPRKIATAEFFLKTYNAEKGDKPLQELISRHVQTRMAAILARLAGKRVFIMGRDGEPTWKEIGLAPSKASILFHFRRNEEGTHYFPTIQYQNQRLDFQYKDALLVCLQPAWLLLGDLLYSFRTEVDGRKLLPFLKKKFIVVPRNVEESYFQKFVAPLMESFEVHARGFDIRSERYVARPRLTFSDALPAAPAPEAPVRPPGPPRRGRIPLPKPVAPLLTGAETEQIHFGELPLRPAPDAAGHQQAGERAPGENRRELRVSPPAAQPRAGAGHGGRAARAPAHRGKRPRHPAQGRSLQVAARQHRRAHRIGLYRGSGLYGHQELFHRAHQRARGHSGSRRLV